MPISLGYHRARLACRRAALPLRHGAGRGCAAWYRHMERQRYSLRASASTAGDLARPPLRSPSPGSPVVALAAARRGCHDHGADGISFTVHPRGCYLPFDPYSTVEIKQKGEPRRVKNRAARLLVRRSAAPLRPHRRPSSASCRVLQALGFVRSSWLLLFAWQVGGRSRFSADVQSVRQRMRLHGAKIEIERTEHEDGCSSDEVLCTPAPSFEKESLS
jgi:hypothetical protein